MTETALYRHYDASGALLYVGVTRNPARRLGDHLNGAFWGKMSASVAIEWHESRDAAVKAEWRAIHAENPLFNIRRETAEPSAKDGVTAKTRSVFGAWLRNAGLKQKKVAADFGFSTSFMSQLCTGKRLPTITDAYRIERYSNGAVTMASWVCEDEDGHSV